MPCAYAMPMLMKWKIRLASMMIGIGTALALVATMPVAQAGGRRDEQDAAPRAVLEGPVMPLFLIKPRGDSPVGGATYVGSGFNPGAQPYRLEHFKGGKGGWVKEAVD